MLPSGATATPAGAARPLAHVETLVAQRPSTTCVEPGVIHGAPAGSGAPDVPVKRSRTFRVMRAAAGLAYGVAPRPVGQPMLPAEKTSAPDAAVYDAITA